MRRDQMHRSRRRSAHRRARSARRRQVLGNLASIVPGAEQGIISHYDVQPVIDIYANVEGTDLGSVTRAMQKIVAKYKSHLPRGSQFIVRGQSETMYSSYIGLLSGLAFSILLVYLLIVVNFQSWLDPFLIIAALPAALAGIVWFLFLTGTHFSVPALTGAIMCMGVATANSILVVSFAREQLEVLVGDARQAALNAGFVRLRPVMMTALAMIIGMVPMALGLGEGGEQNAPLGRAVIGGLLLATGATLFFVPVFFSFIHGRLERRRKSACLRRRTAAKTSTNSTRHRSSRLMNHEPNPNPHGAAETYAAAAEQKPVAPHKVLTGVVVVLVILVVLGGSRHLRTRARPLRSGRAHPRTGRAHGRGRSRAPRRAGGQLCAARQRDRLYRFAHLRAHRRLPRPLVLRHRRQSEKRRAAGRDRHARAGPATGPGRGRPGHRADQCQQRQIQAERYTGLVKSDAVSQDTDTFQHAGRRHGLGGQIRAGQCAAAQANCNPSRRSMRRSTAWSPRATSTPAS